MISHLECALARTVTASLASDSQINAEYLGLSKSQKIPQILSERCSLLEQTDENTLRNNAAAIAKAYSIDPSTLLCVYLVWIARKQHQQHQWGDQ